MPASNYNMGKKQTFVFLCIFLFIIMYIIISVLSLLIVLLQGASNDSCLVLLGTTDLLVKIYILKNHDPLLNICRMLLNYNYDTG